jgi:hemoglobin
MDPSAARQSLFQRIGEEEGVRALVTAFYDLIEQDPEVDPLHRLHLRGHGVAHARGEQFDFLCGFLGGPRPYIDRHGHSRLPEIHAHVPIDAQMSAMWLRTMERAMVRAGVTGELRETLMGHFNRAAAMVVNAPLRLFSYGTLRDQQVQMRIFGRLLQGEEDGLPGYRLSTIAIGSATYPIVGPGPDAAAVIPGVVFEITGAELVAADAYEGAEYRRINVRLRSGRDAWIYAAP